MKLETNLEEKSITTYHFIQAKLAWIGVDIVTSAAPPRAALYSVGKGRVIKPFLRKEIFHFYGR